MNGDAPRSLPGLDRDNRPFWTGGAAGRLLIARCDDCAAWIHPPRPRCCACGGARIAPQAVCGRGRVASYTINHQRWVPGLAVPYVIAAVELEEQRELYLFTNIVGCEPDEVAIGMAVEVEFLQQDDVHLPLFRKRGAA